MSGLPAGDKSPAAPAAILPKDTVPHASTAS